MDKLEKDACNKAHDILHSLTKEQIQACLDVIDGKSDSYLTSLFEHEAKAKEVRE